VHITSYADLIRAASAEACEQRLLFVFAQAELPADATDDQQRRFRSGEGGALIPVMCVAKSPHDAADFQSLVEESRQTGGQWDVVFVSTMTAPAGAAANDAEADRHLDRMVDAIKQGAIGGFLAFTRHGNLVQLEEVNKPHPGR
jgi:hypothetical protein